MKRMRTIFTILAAAFPLVTLAHTGMGDTGGFVSGLEHPISGLDHVVAMVAVGLWGAFLGIRTAWTLPVIFPLVMALGGVLGIAGFPLPGVETGVAVSGIILGALIAYSVRFPLWLAGIIVGIFAVFHGYAHGAELPVAANPFAYAVGFVIATGMLHICGIAVGLLAKWRWGRILVRVGGVIISLTGFGFLFGLL